MLEKEKETFVMQTIILVEKNKYKIKDECQFLLIGDYYRNWLQLNSVYIIYVLFNYKDFLGGTSF